jgi:hypothetical protein
MFLEVFRGHPRQDTEDLQKHWEIWKPLVLLGNHWETLGNIGKPLVLIGKQHNALKTNGFPIKTNVSQWFVRVLDFLIRFY